MKKKPIRSLLLLLTLSLLLPCFAACTDGGNVGEDSDTVKSTLGEMEGKRPAESGINN